MYNNKTLTKLVTKYYFDGHDNISEDDVKMAKGLVSSQPFQQVFCDWMAHTGGPAIHSSQFLLSFLHFRRVLRNGYAKAIDGGWEM